MMSDYEEDEETGDKTYNQIKSGQAATMGGIISAIRKINTRAGAIMAFVTVEDLYGSIDCVAFPRVYERIKPALRQDAVVKISGKIDIDPEKLPVILLDTLEEFEDGQKAEKDRDSGEKGNAERRETKNESAEQVLWLDARSLSEEDFEELLETVKEYEGHTTTKILHGGKRFEYSVNMNRALAAELRTFLPAQCIKLV